VDPSHDFSSPSPSDLTQRHHPKRSAPCSLNPEIFEIYPPRLSPRGMRFHAERCLRLAANRSVSHSLKHRNYAQKPVESADAKAVDYSATLLLPKHDIPFPSRWNVVPANVKNSTVLQKCVDVYKWQVLPVPVLNLSVVGQSNGRTIHPPRRSSVRKRRFTPWSPPPNRD
jgi:hypothetical protein